MAVKIKPLSAGWLLAVFYSVGILGYIIPQTSSYMPSLIWVNLVLTFIVLMCYHKKWTKEFVVSALFMGVSGFFIEVIGVRTGLIFGHYQYGKTLGYMLWSTPVMMALIWLTTLYITRQIAEMIAKDSLLLSAVAASLMLVLDFFIEPFAIYNQMWTWNSGTVPIHNYIGWFFTGFILQYLYCKNVKLVNNKLSLPIYLIQLGFFICFYLVKIKS